jgi:hypothetical protein
MQEKSYKQNIMETKDTTKTEAVQAKTQDNNSKTTPKRKGRLTDYWEKYPEGLLTIVDRRAVLK